MNWPLNLKVINTVQMSLDIIVFSASVILCVKGKRFACVYFNVSVSCPHTHMYTHTSFLNDHVTVISSSSLIPPCP